MKKVLKISSIIDRRLIMTTLLAVAISITIELCSGKGLGKLFILTYVTIVSLTMLVWLTMAIYLKKHDSKKNSQFNK